jgi:putative FmdB family regulatory protein
MPLYEYQCEAGHRFERIQKFSDPPVEICPTCGSKVRKLLSSPAIQFKGSGWYITDYAKKSGGADGKTDGGGEKSSESASKGDAGTGKTAPASSDTSTSTSTGKSE